MSSQPGKAPNRTSERRQRRHPRYRSEFPVTVTVFVGQGHQNLAGHCRDLSEAGMGVLIAAELNLGDVASLAFALPGLPRPWDLRAVLRYRRGYHYGFEFLSLADHQQEALASYVPTLERLDSDWDKPVFRPGNDGNRNHVT